MRHFHMISTTDPMTGRDVDVKAGQPYVVEGDHYSDLTIYFESEDTRAAYLDIPVERPGIDLSVSLDNPTADYADLN
jgi:hypothetical protein